MPPWFFQLDYGQSAFGLSNQLDIEPKEAQEYIDNFYKTFAKVGPYKEKILKQAAKQGFVETLMGRRRYFPDLETVNKMVRANMERMAFNTVFQGSAADIIKQAMLDLDHELSGNATKMILQVHDELIFEAPKSDAEKIKSLVIDKMCGAIKLKVPIKVAVGIGPSWAAAKA